MARGHGAGRRLAVGLCAALALAVQGCTVTTSADDPSSVSGTVADDTRWDLTEPPSRADVGMPEGGSVAVYETDAGRTVTYELPDGVELPVRARLVTFTAFGGSEAAATGAPTSSDAKSPNVDLDTAYGWFVDSLDRVGTGARAADDWRREARQADGVAAVSSEQVSRRFGYVTVRVAARYDPGGETATVSWVLNWM